MAGPDELRDRPTHRVADGDEPLDTQLVGDRDGIVGAISQTEVAVDLDTVTVAAMVDRHDPEVPRQAAVTEPPVEVGRRRETVQQEQDRRPRGPARISDERRAAARPGDTTSRRPRRRVRCDLSTPPGPAHHFHSGAVFPPFLWMGKHRWSR